MRIETHSYRYFQNSRELLRLLAMGFVVGMVLIAASLMTSSVKPELVLPQSVSSGNSTVPASTVAVGASAGFNWLWAIPLVMILAGILYLLSSLFTQILPTMFEEDNDSQKNALKNNSRPAYVGVKGGKAGKKSRTDKKSAKPHKAPRSA